MLLHLHIEDATIQMLLFSLKDFMRHRVQHISWHSYPQRARSRAQLWSKSPTFQSFYRSKLQFSRMVWSASTIPGGNPCHNPTQCWASKPQSVTENIAARCSTIGKVTTSLIFR